MRHFRLVSSAMTADEIAKLKLRLNLIYEIYRRRRDDTYMLLRASFLRTVLSVATCEPRANSHEASQKNVHLQRLWRKFKLNVIEWKLY